MRAIPGEVVRENGPCGEPGVVAEDSPGPSARNDPMDPDRMSADGELRHQRIGPFSEVRSESMHPRRFSPSFALGLLIFGGGVLGASPPPDPRYKLVLQAPPAASVSSVSISPDG